MTSREKNDILPEHNQGIYVVPQILANNGDAFCKALEILEDLGYREVNLNLGCPSGTVVAKGKGSGFLGLPEELERFLDTVFDAAPCAVSIRPGWACGSRRSSAPCWRCSGAIPWRS